MSTLGKIKELMNCERPPITSFKYVILHTCQFPWMDFEAISAIMEPGDKMIMTHSPGDANEILVFICILMILTNLEFIKKKGTVHRNEI
jgi:hypothetical protein